ncbi:MAG: hypothetical protein K2Y10_01860 [Burkholderiaceae bacterium]|nr:hypothetical protein [Burkholderiaceae bacterium]
MNYLKEMGLDDENAKRLSLEFVDSNGDVPYANNAGQIKYGGRNSTLTEALYKAAYPLLFKDQELANSGSPLSQPKAEKSPSGRGNAESIADPPVPAPSPIPQKPDAGRSGATTVVNLHYNGATVGPVKTTDDGANNIQKFMQLLQAGKAAAS